MSSSIGRGLRWNWWAVAPLLLAWAAAAAPHFSTPPLLPLVFAIEHGFSLVCHQHPDRCFWILGAPVAVCARCFGIYLGAAIGLLLRTSRTVALRLLVVASSLNALDVATELAGLHGNWTIVRFALGMMLGVAGALLIASSLPENLPPAEAGSGFRDSAETLA